MVHDEISKEEFERRIKELRNNNWKIDKLLSLCNNDFDRLTEHQQNWVLNQIKVERITETIYIDATKRSYKNEM